MKQRKPIFIIAEAGVNHNGDIDTALRMVDAAAQAGADAVKFQTFKAKNIVTVDAEKAAYQNKTTEASESQLSMLQSLELDYAAHTALIGRCRQNNIAFMSTPFDMESADLLLGLGLEIFKIPSGEITNLPLLRKIGSFNKQVILSSGMASLDEIKDAVAALKTAGQPLEGLTLLHCTTEYPAPLEEVNLLAMQTIHDETGLPVGYSDHTRGIEIPVAAAAMGAVVIEKHFTLDKTQKGPDHRASLEPGELTEMVRAIRAVEAAMGDGIKRATASEKDNIKVIRKSIVAARPIAKGETFTEKNLAVKRPGTGLSPMLWDTVVGQKAPRDFPKDDQVVLK